MAEYVLDRIDSIIYMSITDLSEQVKVGEATVLRFCRKLGFKGYQEFKLAVAKDTVNPLHKLHDNLDESEELQAMVQKLSAVNIRALQDTSALIDHKQLEKAIEMIVGANRLHFYGVGVSGMTAQDAKAQFFLIGKFVDAISDSHHQAMVAATLTSQDVVVGFSISGSTKDTVEALRIAKENGAQIIAITHFARSPITKYADVVLLTAGKESPLQGGSLAGKIAQLHIIDMLCTGVAVQTREKALYYKEKTAKAVVERKL